MAAPVGRLAADPQKYDHNLAALSLSLWET
jgi:hypothetical protein